MSIISTLKIAVALAALISLILGASKPRKNNMLHPIFALGTVFIGCGGVIFFLQNIALPPDQNTAHWAVIIVALLIVAVMCLLLAFYWKAWCRLT